MSKYSRGQGTYELRAVVKVKACILCVLCPLKLKDAYNYIRHGRWTKTEAMISTNWEEGKM